MTTSSAVNPSHAPSDTGAAVSVSIHDSAYHLRGTDPAYIEQLAAQVDAKMRAVSAHGGAVDSLRVAVLAALNIADELETLRAHAADLAGRLHAAEDQLHAAESRLVSAEGRLESAERSARSRTASLAGLLDEALENGRDPRARQAS